MALCARDDESSLAIFKRRRGLPLPVHPCRQDPTRLYLPLKRSCVSESIVVSMGTELNLTLGALLIGVLVTAVGYGVTTTQTYMYMNRFPNDPRGLDTLHIALTWHMIYYYLILNFNNNSALESSVWCAVITVIVHCFYARRIFVLGGRNWYITLFILALSVLRLVECVEIFHLRTFEQIAKKTIAPVIVGLGAGTLADCVITASLVYLLRVHKSGLNPLDSMLDRITYWTVNNGMLTSVVGIAFLVTQFSPIPHNMIFLALHLLLSKRGLNFREAHRGRGLHTEGNSAIHMSNLFRGLHSTTSHTAAAEFTFGKEGQTSTIGSKGPVLPVHIVTTTTTDAPYNLENTSKLSASVAEELRSGLGHTAIELGDLSVDRAAE
ncbi:hypothetical protein OH77DRAFT_1429975 [Trametes cingulata]|nr:hypothetical protein OH77DRAFT_1429975 [Trametes cingulata]